MKYINKLFLIVTLLISTSLIIVFAHPGSLDANGGHWNRKTGDYHYHSGEHTESNYSSSSNDYDYNYEKKDIPAKSVNDSSNENKKQIYSSNVDLQKKEEKETSIVGTIVAGLFLGYIAICTIWSIGKFCTEIIFVPLWERYLKYILPKHKLQRYEDSIIALESHYTKLREAQLYVKSFSMDKIPTNYEIGHDGLPKEKKSNSWGKTFTLYRSKSGNKIHAKRGCSSAYLPVNCCTLMNLKYDISKILCQRCGKGYVLPDLTWYKNYKKYISQKEMLQNRKTKEAELKQAISRQHKKCNSFLTRLHIIFSKKHQHKLIKLNEKSNQIKIL